MSSVSGNPVICARLVTFRLVCLGLHAPNRRASGQSLTLAKLDEPGGRTLPVSFSFIS